MAGLGTNGSVGALGKVFFWQRGTAAPSSVVLTLVFDLVPERYPIELNRIAVPTSYGSST